MYPALVTGHCAIGRLDATTRITPFPLRWHAIRLPGPDTHLLQQAVGKIHLLYYSILNVSVVILSCNPTEGTNVMTARA
jgi:hypothetical protein